MNIKKYKQEILLSFIIFFLLTLGSFLYLSYQYNQKIHDFEHYTIRHDKLLIDTAMKMLQQTADIIYNLRINTSDVVLLMYKANQEKKDRYLIRKKLYNKLKNIYEMLKNYGIKQLHFHLPGAISFLRFHEPEKFGDDLSKVRYSIVLVNKTKKVARGFEEGRVSNGFRNVYPLFYKNKFIGTVEISYSIKAINNILSQHGKNFYALLLDKNNIFKKVWKNEIYKYYNPSLISPNYLWDKKSFDFNNKNEFVNSFSDIEKSIKSNIKKFYNKSFIIPFNNKKKHYIAIFHPLKNIKDKNIGYIVSFYENNFFYQTKKHYLILSFIFLLINFIISILVFFFLRQEKIIKEKLSYFSNHDPLTKLLNRRGLKVALETLLNSFKRNHQPFSILFIDIDHFKKINDTYGHNIGDKVLQKVSDILRTNVRKSDLIARWGGEEFVVILGNTDKEEAKKVAEKLRKVFEKYSDKELPKITASIGVVSVDGDNTDFDINDLFKKADEALYEAKRSGRNRVIFKE